jgi:hypothetical protein
MSLLERLFSIGPVRKAIWQLWYPYLTRRLRSEEVLFLNYAFETDPPVGLQLDAADEPNRACIEQVINYRFTVSSSFSVISSIHC